MAWWEQQDAMQPPLWRDRRQAGVALARRLQPWRGRPDALVIGLPRGGVVVAAEVAQALQLPLASWAVRKLSHPAAPELAVGAIASGGVLIWREPQPLEQPLDPALRRRLVAEQEAECRRRQQLYGDPEASSLKKRPLLVVDDGVATGLTVQAALQSLRQAGPSQLVLAVPVVDRRTWQRLQGAADELVALAVVAQLGAVGQWYERFEPVADQEVLDRLAGRG